MDAVLICVPTPLDERREPDLSYVEKTARAIAPNLQRNQLIVLESTTYPGTTEELVLPILEKGGLRCPIAHGEGSENIATDFYLAFSPEREDPGNKQFGLAQIPKVVGGVNPPSGRAAAGMYAQIVSKVIPVSSTRAAEMVKLLENIFRCVNIALVNELKQLCLRMNLDILEIIDSAATKPFGFMPFYPGPGPRRTLHSGRSVLPFVESSRIRLRHALHRARRRSQHRNALPRGGCCRCGAQSSAKNPSRAPKFFCSAWPTRKTLTICANRLRSNFSNCSPARGAVLDYNDPYFPALFTRCATTISRICVRSILRPERLAGYDCVLIATDHSSYDYDAIVRNAKLVVDTRNATRRVKQNREKIVNC